MNAESESGRFNDFVAMIVIGVLSRVSILGTGLVMSCARRLYDDM